MWEAVEIKPKVEEKPEDTKVEDVKDVKEEDGKEKEKDASMSMEVEEKKPPSKNSSDLKQEQKDGTQLFVICFKSID